MGTNFYLMSRNKKLIREHFAVETEYDIKDIEYAIVDEPYLGYEIHLNKLSCGWRPLFQRHKTIKTFKELEEFCQKEHMLMYENIDMEKTGILQKEMFDKCGYAGSIYICILK